MVDLLAPARWSTAGNAPRGLRDRRGDRCEWWRRSLHAAADAERPLARCLRRARVGSGRAGRQAVAPLGAARRQDRTAGTGAHAQPETVGLRAPAVVRLEG